MWTSPPMPERENEEERRERMLHQERSAEEVSAMLERQSAETHREGVLRIECPMCDALITAIDEEDLSDYLRDHMAERHDIRHKRLEWLTGKR